MADTSNGMVQVQTKHHTEDKYGKKYLSATEKVQQNVSKSMRNKTEPKEPAGGFDDTPIPHAEPGFTVKFTFHKATNLPFADFSSLSSDPYLHATLKTNLIKRHKDDPDLTWRTVTQRRSTTPEWNSEWIVANIPSSGFYLKCRLYDEDAADHDDRLGNVHIKVPFVSEEWPGIKKTAFKVKKRMGSKRAYLFRGCAALVRGVEMSGELIFSAEVLGRTESDNGGQIFTVGPCQWSKHFSPLIGRLTGTKGTEESNDGTKVERYNFQATQIQLRGPVPSKLYHRYVEFKPFVGRMFGATGLRGKVLNRALHHQHARIYNYDRSTVCGSFPEPCTDLTKHFLDCVHYDQGGRIFTYVLTLDGQWRFTETGQEFGIDLLSKHTMHSDVSSYIAYSGEFFVRKLKHPHLEDSQSADPESFILSPAPEPDGDDDLKTKEPSHDPTQYQLIIDNDSGTYRPNAKYLDLLKDFISKNLPGLSVRTLDCQKDEKQMKKLKDQQHERKKSSGKQITYLQNGSVSSLSSSDEERLDAAEEQGTKKKLGQSVRDPKRALLSALDAATGPASAVDHSGAEKGGGQSPDGKETKDTKLNET